MQTDNFSAPQKMYYSQDSCVGQKSVSAVRCAFLHHLPLCATSLPYSPSVVHDRLNQGASPRVDSCSTISLENRRHSSDVTVPPPPPLSLICKKVSIALFPSPLCFQSPSLPKHISTFLLPLSLLLPSFSGSINHAWERRALSWGNFLGVEWVIH